VLVCGFGELLQADAHVLNFLARWVPNAGCARAGKPPSHLTLHRMTPEPAPSFEEQLVAQRDYLLRFARLQLRNDAWAEDAVSETVLAALAKPQAFGNRSQLKTWLVGILKHKVIDALRHHSREISGLNAGEEDDTDPLEYLGFKADGHFSQMPTEWGNPVQQVRSRQFFEIMDACIDKLPATQGRLFLMREWLELSSEEICKELNLTSTNLYVQLHRARLRLRECLELNWFGKPHKT
jgi:RNA polymerase sigma-70 factor (TIGR02943 family)